jgi:DNA-binding CsgD family transcriptional regulator
MASSVNLSSAATKLTEKILGYNADDLAEILKEIASEIGVCHIAHMRFGPSKSSDVSLLTAVNTYAREWQYRYFVKQYLAIDPVVERGRTAILPFDWETLNPNDDPAVTEFFADAIRHNVGRHGVAIPVRNRRNAYSLVCFSCDFARPDWDLFKRRNMPTLQQLSALIDSAASIEAKLPPAPVQLSRREEQCLIWAARGKTYQEIGEILELSYGSVKSHLDTARHKLHCLNLTHAVGVALATGVIPPQALRGATEGENRADS